MDEPSRPSDNGSAADGGISPADATNGLRRACVVGFALLASLAILGQVFVQRSLDQQAGDTNVVNLAGIQRARSERLAKELLATVLIDRPDAVTASGVRLETTLNIFKQTWAGLLEGDAELSLSPITDPASVAQYAVTDVAYIEFVESLDRTLTAHRSEVDHSADLADTLAAQRQFFGEANGLTNRLEEASAAKLSQTRRLQYLFLAATLIALIGLGVGSFLPALRRLRRSIGLFEALSTNSPDPLIMADCSGNVFHQNPAAVALFGHDGATSCTVADLLGPAGAEIEASDATELIDLHRQDGTTTPLRVTTTVFSVDTDLQVRMYLVHDRTSELEEEKRQRQTEKLEAIGVLAAGIAHEINTPTQFVRDNLSFIDESVTGLLEVTGQVEAITSDPGAEPPGGIWTSLSDKLTEIDVEFIREELGSSIHQSMDGMNRVAEIVRAMKDFSHPGADGLAPANINDALSTTSIICRSEWSHVAELELDLHPDLPMVPVLLGDIKQVFLNLIVNAAHAIEGAKDTGPPGHILIKTRVEADHAIIEILDNGPGVPEEIRERIFEPFFTTKEVGKGTGQGLAICQRVVVEGHDGTVEVDTPENNIGSIFRIRLPIADTRTTQSDSLSTEPALAGL